MKHGSVLYKKLPFVPLMRKILTLLLACLPFLSHAQTTPNATAVSAGTYLAKGMCECFTKHVLPNLTPIAKGALDKLAKNNVTTKEQARKVLSVREIMAISNEMQAFIPSEGNEETDFGDCQDTVGMGMMQFQGQITELTANKVMTEEELDKQIQEQTFVALRKDIDCQNLYYIMLISQEQ
jgi:hypothetical protein